jgi:hypothetical protein
MPQPLTDLEAAEFAALRATIRQRGTLRFAMVWAVFTSWGALALGATLGLDVPAASLVPLLSLAAGYEVVHGLSTNVERIGRYLQVRYESGHSQPLWEETAMRFGQKFPGRAPDPLAAGLFAAATAVNFIPVAAAGYPAEKLTLGAAHALLILRVLLTRRAAGRQRVEDLARYREVLGQGARD